MGNSGDGGQMEREPKVAVGVPKSLDQLKNQVRQTNVFRIVKEDAEPLTQPDGSSFLLEIKRAQLL